MTKTIRSPSGNKTEVVSSFKEHLDTSPSDHGSLIEEDDEDADESDGGVSTALPIVGPDQEPTIDYMLALVSEDCSIGDSTTNKPYGNANSNNRENNFVNGGNQDTNEDNDIDTISPTFLNARRKRARLDDTQTSIWHPPMALREQHDAFQPAMTNGQSLAHGNAAIAFSDVIMAEDGIHEPDHPSVSTSDDIAGPATRKISELAFIRNPARGLYPVKNPSDTASESLSTPSMLDSFRFIISVWPSESSVALSGPAITETHESSAIIVQHHVSGLSSSLCLPLIPWLISH